MPKTVKSKKLRQRVIDGFRQTGRVDLACTLAGIHKDTHYTWLKKDPEYREAFEAAKEPVIDLLVDEGMRRALSGVDEPVFSAGKRVLDYARDEQGQLITKDGKHQAIPATVRRYSDRLLEFLLSGIDADRFGRQRLDHRFDKDDTLRVIVEHENKPIP